MLDDLGEVFLVKRETGAWNYYSRDDLELPREYVPARDRVNLPAERMSSN